MKLTALLLASAVTLTPFVAASAQQVPAGGFGDNILINPWMEIDQKNEGASTAITRTAAGTFTFFRSGDGWSNTSAKSQNSTATTVYQNAAVAPDGSIDDMKYTENATVSQTHADGTLITIEQRVEPMRLAPLQYGTANAQGSYLTFCAKASVAGTYGFYIAGGLSAATTTIASGAGSQSGSAYFHAFSIPTAGQWNCPQFYIPGDTGGTWLVNSSTNAVDATHGATLGFVLSINGLTTTAYGVPDATHVDGVWQNITTGTEVIGVNSTYVPLEKTASATFELTGVKWSLNPTVPTHNAVAELQEAQRYFQKSFQAGYGGNSGLAPAQQAGTGSNVGAAQISAPVIAAINKIPIHTVVPMRTTIATGQTTTFDAQAADSKCFDITGGATQAVATFDASSAASDSVFTIGCAASGVATAGNLQGIHWQVDLRE